MEVQTMLYVSIKDEERMSYERKAVVDELILEEGIEEAENIKLDFVEDGKKLKLFTVPENEASKSDYLIVNRIGLYKGITTNLDILFLDEETMLVGVNSGCVFIRSEFVPDKKPTFALTRDREAIDNQEIDMVAMLDNSGLVNNVNSSNVHWVSTKDLYSLIKSSGEKCFGLHSNKFTMDYYYSVEVVSSAYWDRDREHIQTGYKIVCTDSIDLSYGKVSEYEAKEEKHRERIKQLEWDKKMEEQRKMLERLKNQSYFDEETDEYIDEYLLDMMDDEDF